MGICWWTSSIFELLAKKKKAGLCTRLFFNKTFSARHFMVTHLFSNFVLTLHQRVLHTHVVEKSYRVEGFIFKIDEVTTFSVRSIYKGKMSGTDVTDGTGSVTATPILHVRFSKAGCSVCRCPIDL